MTNDEARQAVVDEVQLQALAIGYKVTAGMAAFFACLGLFYAGMFGLMFHGLAQVPRQRGANPPPEELGWVFVGFGFGLFALMVLFTVLNWRVARCLEKRRSRTYCQILAALNCLHVPYGTALGVCTLVVLERPSVASLFVPIEAPARRR